MTSSQNTAISSILTKKLLDMTGADVVELAKYIAQENLLSLSVNTPNALENDPFGSGIDLATDLLKQGQEPIAVKDALKAKFGYNDDEVSQVLNKAIPTGQA